MIEAYLTDAIIWNQAGDPDQWGEVTYTPVAIRARYEDKVRTVTGPAGNEVVSGGAVLMVARPAMTDTFEIDGVVRAIVSIGAIKAFDGHGVRVYLA